MSKAQSYDWLQADHAPVLISGDINEDKPVYVTWGYVDHSYSNIDGGHWMVLTNDESKAFTCDECGCLCHHPLDTYSYADVDTTMQRLGRSTENGVEFYSVDKNTICDGCCESAKNRHGGVNYVYDEDTTEKLSPFEDKPADVVNELGGVQIDVLHAIAAEADVGPSETGESPYTDVWADRVEVSRQVASYRDAKNANSYSATISRAVHSLINRGLVAGAYRGWHTWYGESPPQYTESDEPRPVYSATGMSFGTQGPTPEHDNDNDRPTLEKVRLRNDGKYVVALSVLDRDDVVSKYTMGE